MKNIVCAVILMEISLNFHPIYNGEMKTLIFFFLFIFFALFFQHNLNNLYIGNGKYVYL